MDSVHITRKATASVIHVLQEHGPKIWRRYGEDSRNLPRGPREIDRMLQLKWDAAESTQGTFTFTGSDYLVNWACLEQQTNPWTYTGFDVGLPSWVSDITDADTLWDVCNEVLNEDYVGDPAGRLSLVEHMRAGTDVAITELDIASASASDYTTVVDACLSNSACVLITSWGVSDVNSCRQLYVSIVRQ
ncbi:hypothetical protein F5146DRAFT_1129101 [Armillaria mellea]|nr:hypothetical protein F5146DRAFT_1129101 [Armillaria mellea]